MVSMVSIACVVLILMVALVVLARLRRSSPAQDHWPLYARPPLTREEQAFYWRLWQALPEHVVLAQVSFSQLLAVRRGTGSRGVANRFRQLTADFVICKRDFSVVAVIEVDDTSHDSPRRQVADAKKESMLRAVGIPLLRMNTASLPNESEIRAQLGIGSAGRAGVAREATHDPPDALLHVN